jgi:hypothetical protein
VPGVGGDVERSDAELFGCLAAHEDSPEPLGRGDVVAEKRSSRMKILSRDRCYDFKIIFAKKLTFLT